MLSNLSLLYTIFVFIYLLNILAKLFKSPFKALSVNIVCFLYKAAESLVLPGKTKFSIFLACYEFLKFNIKLKLMGNIFTL